MRSTTYGGNLTGGVETTVFTVPTGYYAKWSLMYLFNGTGSTKAVTAVWHDQTTGSDIYILNGYGLSSKTPLQFDSAGSYVVLEEGDTVKITSESGSTMSYICTFEVEKKTGI